MTEPGWYNSSNRWKGDSRGGHIWTGLRQCNWYRVASRTEKDDAAQEEKMELLHRRCCSLDVHKETVVACLRLIRWQGDDRSSDLPDTPTNTASPNPSAVVNSV